MLPATLWTRRTEADTSLDDVSGTAPYGASTTPVTPLPRLRFATLLFGLVLAVLVPSLTLGVVATWHAVSGQRAAAEGRLLDTARALALAVDADIGADVQALATLASSPAFDRGADADPATVDPILRRAAAVFGSPISLIAPDGHRIAHTGVPLGAPIPPSDQIPALRKVLETGQPLVLDVHKGPVAGAPTVSAMVPVVRQGDVVSVLSIRIAPARLQRLLAGAGLDPGSFAALIDSHQALVARSDMRDYPFVGRVVPLESATALAAGHSGLFDTTSHDGIARLAGFHALPSIPGWHVVVADPASTIDAAWRGPLLAFITGGGLTLALAIVLSLLLAQHILVPLRRLGGHARAVAATGGILADGFTAGRLPPAPVTELEALRRGFAAAEIALRRRAEAEKAAATALAAREAELGAMFEASPIGIARCDFSGRMIDANEIALRILGITREALLAGRAWWKELTPPEFHGVTERAITDALAAPDGRCGPHEKEVLRPDGTRVPVLNSVAILDRAAEEAVVFVMDLTAIRRSEARIAESEGRLHELLATVLEGIIMAGEDGGIITVNPAAVRMFGYETEAELVGQPLGILMPAQAAICHDGYRGDQRSANLAGAIDLPGQELTGWRKDGSAFLLDLSVSSFRADNARFFTAVLRDATERKQAEAALRDSEARFRALADATTEGVVIHERGMIMECNSSFVRMLGYTERDAVIGRDVADFFDPAYVPAARARSRAGSEDPYESMWRRADGSFIPAEVNARALRFRDRPMRVAAVRDLSRQKAAEAALRENEARLHAIGEATPALIFSLDRQNRMIYANPATLAVIGRPAEEVLGRTAAEYHSNIAELHDMTRTNRRIMESGQPETVEESFSAVDGGPRVFLSTKAPLRDPSNGAIVGITVVSRDITEQRLVEAGQARLAAIVASTPDAVVSFAADDGLVLSWNRAAEDLFGWTEAEALGRPASLLVPDFRPDGDPTGVYRMTLAGQLVRDHETIRQAKSGELIPVSVAASRMVAPDGRVIGISAIFRDLRPRRAAESALRESEERLRLATEVAQVGILDLDLRTNELRRDERLRALWGMPPGLPDSMDAFYAGLHPDDLARVKAAVAAALDPAGDGSLDSEYRVIDLTNRAERIISAKGQVWFEGGGAVRMVGTVVDVTARRRAEAVLARDKAELERLVEARTQELEQVQEQLAHAQRMEALGRLAGGVAHDFNNVLQAVHGGVSMASRRMRTNPERAQSYLDMVASAAERGAAVTSRLLAFARRSELSAGPVAPAPLLDGLAQLLRPSFGPRIRLRVTVEPEMPAIFADANQLETVMVNLTNNARDALPSDGGTIHLVVAIALPGEAPAHLAPGRYGRLSVTDDGVGMTAEVLARVSEPFFTTKPKGKGTGLGLAMARGFAEQSGGGLTIESERGVGTTVSLWLPLAPAANNGGDMAGPPAREADDAAGSGMAMLLVDDDPAVRVVLAAMLAEQGHAVTEAADATAALALFDTNIAADVLVTDLTMPGDMDGLALVLEARRRRPGLPAVLITGDAGAAGHHALERVSGSGPFAMLNKPVSAKALTAQVADLLRGV